MPLVPSLGSLIDQPRLLRTVALASGGLIAAQWALADVLHIPGGGLGLLAIGGGVLWLRGSSPRPTYRTPSTLKAWIQHCAEVLDQFEAFETQAGLVCKRQQRQDQLDALLHRSDPLGVAVVTSEGVQLPDTGRLQSALSGRHPLTLCMGKPLPSASSSWSWPAALDEQDALLVWLPLPLRAADLLRLQQVPERQSIWLVVNQADQAEDWSTAYPALLAQLPECWHRQLLIWDGAPDQLRALLLPIRRQLQQPRLQRDLTRQRLLEALHREWQAELEALRRERFRTLLVRSQWLVAGAVVASPLPSTDLLSVAVGNGLLLREMGAIWGCSWSPAVLQVVARHLAAAALGQGVVEWTGQALLGLAKLDGGAWIAAGVLQGLSAAYLTRVVGSSIADWMALNAGVAEPDLELLKQQAPLLVARATERERLDWQSFLQQAAGWVRSQAPQLS